MSATTVVILAAGQGKRMRSARPKVLHPLCGRPMLAWVIDQALGLKPQRILLVVGHGGEEVERALEATRQREHVTLIKQEPQLGTGHALQCCLPALGAADKARGRTFVLYGDMPLLEAHSLERLLEAQANDARGGAALLTSFPDDARGFGRILRVDQPGAENFGDIQGIVEERDASEEQREIPEVNLGVYCFDSRALITALPKLSNKNAQGEFYLTDVIGMFVRAKQPVAGVELENPDEAIGVNTISQLAEARWALQVRLLEQHMENGVYIEDPATTYIDHGVEIGVGTKILPCTVIRSGVKIGAGCEVGPFTQLRAGTVLADGAEIGNFTECKNARIGAHAKAKHLAYIGDAQIGARTNVGAGTIFANYDGVDKHQTQVGDKVFLGSGTVIVAPNTIADGATTGAGAVITRNANIGKSEVWVGVPAKVLAPRSSATSSKNKDAPRHRQG